MEDIRTVFICAELSLSLCILLDVGWPHQLGIENHHVAPIVYVCLFRGLDFFGGDCSVCPNLLYFWQHLMLQARHYKEMWKCLVVSLVSHCERILYTFF